jgi:UDP-N-acetylglucosamine acyltransferase
VPDPENYTTYFMKIDNVRFKQKVVPGDSVIFHLELLSPIRRGLVHMRGRGFVRGVLVSEAEMLAQGAAPQDLKYDGEATTVEIGDRTVIRECATVNRATADRWVTRVGSDCLLMAYTHLAHDVHVGDHVIIANTGNIAGHVTIEDWVIIEGMVGVQQFVTIGQHAFVAGGSLVRKNIPPYIKAAREPLSYIGVNAIGLRRRGYDADRIQRIEDIYRTLYVQNGNMAQALKIADAELPSCEDKDTVLEFIRASDKGIIRGPF